MTFTLTKVTYHCVVMLWAAITMATHCDSVRLTAQFLETISAIWD